MEETTYEFDLSSAGTGDNIIKVIGVGGGGSNAVNFMYRQGIKDVDFYVCNTDNQALDSSPVPNKIRIGETLTQGLGAGANPEVGRNAAVESKQDIKQLLQQNTKMLFITAGMGGGTGTGAAPVIAEISRELGILTVGIVTKPFGFEGKPKNRRAEEGIEELRKYCDTVLIILNDKLREVFGRASFSQAFSQADDILNKAAKSIAEIITVSGFINVDFEDVRTVMQDSGVAVMGSSTMSGEDRAIQAAELAVTSPLLNNTDIRGAKYILLSIVVNDMDNFQMEELETITNYVREKAEGEAELIFGVATDDTIGDAIAVTIIATGFTDKERVEKKEVIDLESNRRVMKQVSIDKKEDFFDSAEDENEESGSPSAEIEEPVKPQAVEQIKFELGGNYEIVESEKEKQQVRERKQRKREDQYRTRKEQFSAIRSVSDMTGDEIKERQEMPAYMRKGVKLNEVPSSSEQNISRYSIDKDNDLLGDNKFLHDNVD